MVVMIMQAYKVIIHPHQNCALKITDNWYVCWCHINIILYDHIAGQPSAVGGITTSTSGCFSITVSWDPVTSDPVCGQVSYQGLALHRGSMDIHECTTFQTSCNFTGLRPNNYTVAVVGINDAGIGEYVSMIVSIAGNFSVCT